MKRKWIIPVAVVLVLVLVFVGWRALRRRSAQGQAQYATATVERGPLEVTVTNTGSLASGAQQDLRPTITATVDEVLAKIGESVKEGQVLARMSNPDLYSALEQARANYNAEQEKYSDMVNPASNDVKNAEFKVKQAEYALSQRQADVDGLTVKTPITGIIASVGANAGEDVSSQGTLATILDLNAMTLSTTVSQWAADDIHLGDTAEITANGKTVAGKVSSIIPSASGNVGNGVTIPITIALDPIADGDYVRPGMIGNWILDRTELEGTGTISARTYTVRSRTSATVTAVSVSVGDKVASGQTLMTMTSDSATLALQQAEVDLGNAQQALNNLVTPDATVLASEQAKLAQTRTAYESAQADVNELTIKAPFDGIVTACNIDAGDRVAQNSSNAAFVVADFSKMSIKISVDELDVAKLKVGMEATVDVQAKPGQTYKAVVSSISPQGAVSQGVATYPVELQLTDPKDLLAGMTANVSIICDRRDAVLYVPVEAVQTVRDRSVVRVLDATGKPSSVEVQTGLSNDLYTEIVSGLTEGQTVVTGTASSNSNGMRFGGMGMGGQVRTETSGPNAKPVDGGK